MSTTSRQQPKTTRTTIPYAEVPDGAYFRVLKDEKHGDRVVKNNGTYQKIANSHAVDIHTRHDCIFALKTPCQVITASKR